MENKTIVLTYLHTPFWGSDQFYKSTERVGLPVYNAWNPETYNGTVGSIMYMLYEALLFLRDKYTHVIYSDAADTYFLKAFQPPDFLLISAEKACFPDPALADQYPTFSATPWKFVNAGNWCGPIECVISFFEKYKLNSYKNEHVNGQREWHHAFLTDHKNGMAVHLDYNCLYMQSIAFEDPGDFAIQINRELEVLPKMINGTPRILNLKTGTEPAVFHGNGRTNMDFIYNLYK